MKRKAPLFVTKECPNCKCKFIKSSNKWAYKVVKRNYSIYYCSYSCMRKAQEVNVSKM